MTEKTTRKRVRRDFRAKLAGAEMFLRVNINVLDAIKPQLSAPEAVSHMEGQRAAYVSVLRHLGVEEKQ